MEAGASVLAEYFGAVAAGEAADLGVAAAAVVALADSEAGALVVEVRVAAGSCRTILNRAAVIV